MSVLNKLDCQIVILAAGNGSRMSSDLPKVMHELGGKSTLERVFNNAKIVSDNIILVYSQMLLKYLSPYKDLCKLALQQSPEGTAHAVAAAGSYLDNQKPVIVIYGDNPLITSEIMISITNHLQLTKAALVTLAFNRTKPGQYGRIITDNQGKFIKIKEYKDADEKELEVTLCNSGIMVFAPDILKKYLPFCMESIDSATEYYLTKIVEICVNAGEKVEYFLSHDPNLVVGVNTKEELIEAKKILENQSSN